MTELTDALVRRGATLETIGNDTELVVGRGFVRDHLTWAVPEPARVVCMRRDLTKTVLRKAGVQVPNGKGFVSGASDSAWMFATKMPKPWVIKSAFGGYVHMNVRDPADLPELFARASQPWLLVEEQVEGPCHRILVTAEKSYARHHVPLVVTGDGERKIASLVRIDDVVVSFLARAGLGPRSVLKAGRNVMVRPDTCGGQGTDVTDTVAPAIVASARAAVSAIAGLRYAAVDLVGEHVLHVNPACDPAEFGNAAVEAVADDLLR